MTKFDLIYPQFLIADKIFNEFFKDDFQCAPSGFPVYDMWSEKDGTLVQEWALAGYSLNDLKVEVEGDKLTISSPGASTKQEGVVQGRRIAKRSFKEMFTDYKGVLDLTKIKATFVDGVLRVEIPPKEKKESVVVEICGK